jgi:hypothetical protein
VLDSPSPPSRPAQPPQSAIPVRDVWERGLGGEGVQHFRRLRRDGGGSRPPVPSVDLPRLGGRFNACRPLRDQRRYSDAQTTRKP